MHDNLEPQRTLRRMLRELPTEQAAPYGYHEFERRARERQAAAQRRAGALRRAVALIALLAALPIVYRLTSTTPHVPLAAVDLAAPAAGPQRTQRPAAERLLAGLPAEPALIHVGTHTEVVRLQDRIAQVDDLLSAESSDRAEPARLLALRRERTRLVGTLAQVRYAEVVAYEMP